MELSEKTPSCPRPATPAWSVCVYCGALPGRNPAYARAAQQVGQWLGQHGVGLVYGGGNTGLMGEVARAALQAGGHVTGFIPQMLVEREQALHSCTSLHIVETMHQRKHGMAAAADAFLALPGGLGTLEELFEIWTWRHLGSHHKPIALLNTDGYYDHLLQFLHHSHQQGFVRDVQMQMLHAGRDAAAVLSALQQSVQAAASAQAPASPSSPGAQG